MASNKEMPQIPIQYGQLKAFTEIATVSGLMIKTLIPSKLNVRFVVVKEWWP